MNILRSRRARDILDFARSPYGVLFGGALASLMTLYVVEMFLQSTGAPLLLFWSSLLFGSAGGGQMLVWGFADHFDRRRGGLLQALVGVSLTAIVYTLIGPYLALIHQPVLVGIYVVTLVGVLFVSRFMLLAYLAIEAGVKTAGWPADDRRRARMFPERANEPML